MREKTRRGPWIRKSYTFYPLIYMIVNFAGRYRGYFRYSLNYYLFTFTFHTVFEIRMTKHFTCIKMLAVKCGKNDFAETSKNLGKHRSESDFVGSSK